MKLRWDEVLECIKILLEVIGGKLSAKRLGGLLMVVLEIQDPFAQGLFIGDIHYRYGFNAS